MILFTKTYPKDYEWLKLAVKSVHVLCQENVDWYIVTDNAEKENLRNILENIPIKQPPKLRIFIHEISEHWPEASHMPIGYLSQQWVKMTANRVAGDGLFWNWDSDVIAIKPFSSKTFLSANGKPIYWISQLNHLIASGGDAATHNTRRDITKLVLGCPNISFEFMRCMPVPLYGHILKHAFSQAEWDRAKNILISGDHRFSEFNVMGQYFHLYYPDLFDWKNPETSGPTWSGGYVEGGVGSGAFQEHAIVAQCWSWGGIPPHVIEFVKNL